MTVTEAIAKLEAKLRDLRVNPKYDDGRMLTQEGLTRMPHDPATAEGREWWCEALGLAVYTMEWPGGWNAHTMSKGPLGNMPILQVVEDSRTEAIIAAIEAAAEQYAKEAAARPS